jgi:ankyrin repeat protein
VAFAAHEAVVMELLARGADSTRRSDAGHTAFDIAAVKEESVNCLVALEKLRKFSLSWLSG